MNLWLMKTIYTKPTFNLYENILACTRITVKLLNYLLNCSQTLFTTWSKTGQIKKKEDNSVLCCKKERKKVTFLKLSRGKVKLIILNTINDCEYIVG